mgnify:FL=1
MKLFKKDQAPSRAEAPAEPVKTVGKGRATPKRKDAQARRLHPIVPADRKAARREARAKRDEAWERQRQAMITGDERYLPARDKGPIKRYLRDYVDARYSIGELFMPSAILLLLITVGFSAIRGSQAPNLLAFYIMVGIYLLFFAAIFDALICWRLVRRRLYAKFGEERVRGEGMIIWYVFARCMNLRRWRQPAPQVARREYPS